MTKLYILTIYDPDDSEKDLAGAYSSRQRARQALVDYVDGQPFSPFEEDQYLEPPAFDFAVIALSTHTSLRWAITEHELNEELSNH